MGRVIQISQNDFLQDQNFQNQQKFFFFSFIKSFKIIASYTFSLLHLNKIKLLHHTQFSKSFTDGPAAAELAETTFQNSGAVQNNFPK